MVVFPLPGDEIILTVNIPREESRREIPRAISSFLDKIFCCRLTVFILLHFHVYNLKLITGLNINGR
jgi:hypothetical protein